MTDETKNTTPEPEQEVDAAVGVVADDYGNVQALTGVAVQGNQAVIVAQFADMDAAKAAYYALVDAEAERAIDIAAVLVANADYQGKVHIQKMTDHKTRNGFLWGAAAGAVIGLIFPPAILGAAVGVGIAGAAVGKAGNVMMKSESRTSSPRSSRPARRASWPSWPHRGRRGHGDHPAGQGRQVGARRRRDRRRGHAGRQGERRRVRGLIGDT